MSWIRPFRWTKEWSYPHRLVLLIVVVFVAQVVLTHIICVNEFASVQERADCVFIAIAHICSQQVVRIRWAMYWVFCPQSSRKFQGRSPSRLLWCFPRHLLGILVDNPLDQDDHVIDVTWMLYNVACGLMAASVTRPIFMLGLGPGAGMRMSLTHNNAAYAPSKW